MTNRMTKVERRTNEAIASIFRATFSRAHRCLKCADTRSIGQRLQGMRQGQNSDAQVDLVASINAAEHERDEAVNEQADDSE